MTQMESLQAIAQATGLPVSRVKEFFVGVEELAQKTMKKMDTLIFPGIGKLTAKHRPARKGRNPATGATIKIAAKKVVKFSVARSLKRAVL